MRFKIPLVLMLLSCAVALSMPSPKTGGAVITWVQDYSAPEDTGIVVMNVYYWANGSTLTNSISVATSAANPTVKASILGLTRNTVYNFAVTSETADTESDFGPVVSLLIPKKPNPPGQTGGNAN